MTNPTVGTTQATAEATVATTLIPGSIGWIKGASDEEFGSHPVNPMELDTASMLAYLERVAAIAEGKGVSKNKMKGAMGMSSSTTSVTKNLFLIQAKRLIEKYPAIKALCTPYRVSEETAVKKMLEIVSICNNDDIATALLIAGRLNEHKVLPTWYRFAQAEKLDAEGNVVNKKTQIGQNDSAVLFEDLLALIKTYPEEDVKVDYEAKEAPKPTLVATTNPHTPTPAPAVVEAPKEVVVTPGKVVVKEEAVVEAETPVSEMSDEELDRLLQEAGE